MSDDLLKELIQENDYIEYLHEFSKELEGQSDRGVVVLSVSILEEVLKKVLEAAVLDDKGLFKKLTNINGAFGNFDNNIHICRAFNLISKTDFELLLSTQKIRNKFAHQVRSISFENQAISQLCNNMSLPKNVYLPDNFKKELTYESINPITQNTSNREKFIMVFKYLFIQLGLRSMIQEIKKLFPELSYLEGMETLDLNVLIDSFEKINDLFSSLNNVNQIADIEGIEDYKIVLNLLLEPIKEMQNKIDTVKNS